MDWLWLLPAAIAALIAVAIIRTLIIKAPKYEGRVVDFSQRQLDAYARKLGAMIRVPTISKREDEDLTQFSLYQQELKAHFPHVHKTLDLNVLQGSLLYRWHGTDRDKKPILFMGHQDVVPATADGWRTDPFAGNVIDGKLYGRGAQDCKGTMFAQLQAVEELLAEGFEPPCDIYLAYAINEEIGGLGAKMIAQHLAEQGIELSLVLDEGGALIDKAVDGMDRPYAVVGVTEKGYMDLKITAQGKGGHSSTPPKRTPAARLFAFANEIEKKRPFKKRLMPEAAKMLSRMAPAFPFGLRFILGNMWLFKWLVMTVMPRISPFGEAIMATTCCFTMMQGSDAPNVIASEPYIVANVRTTAFQGCEASLAVIKKYAHKYGLKVDVLLHRDASPVSNIHSAEYAYVEDCIRHKFPGVGVTPYIIMGGTDCRHFHALTENALRFSPVPMSSEQSSSCHGVNENVDVTALCEGVGFYKYLIESYGL